MLLRPEVVPCSWVILLPLEEVPAVRFQDLLSVALGIQSTASNASRPRSYARYRVLTASPAVAVRLPTIASALSGVRLPSAAIACNHYCD